MTHIDFSLTRRSVLFAAVASLLQTSTLFAGEKQVITVHKDPACGCCSGWVEHLQKAGFATKVLNTKDLDAVKRKLGVPDDLAACHTAEVSGYVVEGHVPAAALTRFLAEKLHAKGLAVPGMGRLPAILAVEIPLPWRSPASRRGPARADPTDER